VKKALLVIVSVVWALGAGAQGAARLVGELARPGYSSSARVEVTTEGSAATAVQAADHNPARSDIQGYRVRLFSDNSQNARQNAYATAELFSETFPGIAVEVSYEVPYFLVTAGNCVDHLDAVALRGKALAQFPKAVVVRQEIPLAVIIAEEKNEATVEIRE
jgi:hypothetical protein